jgi:hypothetical protein
VPAAFKERAQHDLIAREDPIEHGRSISSVVRARDSCRYLEAASGHRAG